MSGRVETPGAEKQLPITGVMVTLHRVASDSSGPLDSVRTDLDGRYRLNYNRFGEGDAIYFAAAVYRGIAYFSTPLRSVRASGEEGTITVFDTTSKPVELHVRGHHVVVSAPRPDGSRDVIEVWELSNDTTVTVVGRDSLSAVWRTPLPAGAANVVGGQGDVTPDAIVARGDHVEVVAPFGPGVKQVSYSYTLPSNRFPVTLVMERPASVLEVLLEEPLAQASGGSLAPMEPATTSGRTFKRYLAQDVPAGATVRITAPTTTASTRERVLAGLAGTIALVMVVALARALRAGRGSARVPAAPAPGTSDVLLAAIAQLDVRREQGDPALDEATYVRERAALKSQLAATLASH